jgi:flagellar biosynthesis protein FlhF
MLVRTYSGRTVAEALAKVRAHLGDAALIIETRPVKEPGLFGRAVGYEVVAASDEADDEPRRQTTAAGVTLAPLGAEPEPAPTYRSTGSAPTQAQALASGAPIDQELAAIRRQLARLAAGQGTPTGHLGEDLARDLEDRELPAEIVAELDDAVGRAGPRLDASQRRPFCASVLARGLDRVTAIDWGACRRLLVVGPTGVGKTTTIAKLAGDLVLKQKRKVAMVTIDTYRVGATDQLKAYADLLDIPVEIAATPAQLAESLRRFSDADHVLIDTAGRSPADAARVHELKGFCRCAPGISVMLACAANAGRAEFAAVVERFSILPVEMAAVTKLDECAAPGRLYGCLRRHRLPVAVVTTGQEVPADIAPATAQDLAARVVESAVAAVA